MRSFTKVLSVVFMAVAFMILFTSCSKKKDVEVLLEMPGKNHSVGTTAADTLEKQKSDYESEDPVTEVVLDEPEAEEIVEEDPEVTVSAEEEEPVQVITFQDENAVSEDQSYSLQEGTLGTHCMPAPERDYAVSVQNKSDYVPSHWSVLIIGEDTSEGGFATNTDEIYIDDANKEIWHVKCYETLMEENASSNKYSNTHKVLSDADYDAVMNDYANLYDIVKYSGSDSGSASYIDNDGVLRIRDDDRKFLKQLMKLADE